MAATSAANLEPVAKITARLKALLERAREIKPDASVETLLPTLELSDEVDALHNDFDERYDPTHRFLAVETAARDLFYSLIRSSDIENPSFMEVWNFLDIILLCGDHGKCTPELVCWLLEELLDSQTTDGCRTVFDYLESRRERLARKDFHKKNLIFLRSCNELLRRLSRAEDAIFCGRVFFFLFQTFPLGDKSSVNLRGEFHVENTTKFDLSQSRKDNKTSADAKDKIQPPTSKEGEETALPSSELYPIFWRLQHDFSDPTRLYDTNNFLSFTKGLENTITKFKRTPTVVQTKASEEDKRGTKRKFSEDGSPSEDEEHLTDNYNPKYLTSRDLFDLELSDLAFQRHILVQALILIDFLLSLTEKAKKKLATLPTPNKSMLYNFTLGEEDSTWAVSTRATITSYLGLTLEGRQYCRMVETVLARDKNWVRWKIESCPSIVRGPVPTEEEMAARKGAREAVRIRRIPDKPVGDMNLNFLNEDAGGGFEALKVTSRFTAPSVEELVDGARKDKLDLDMAMDDEERMGLENAVANKKWRALRQARLTNLILLDQADSTKDLEEIFNPRGQADGEVNAQSGEDAGLSTAIAGDDVTAPDVETLPGNIEDKALAAVAV